jgi:hypothetical protein
MQRKLFYIICNSSNLIFLFSVTFWFSNFKFAFVQLQFTKLSTTVCVQQLLVSSLTNSVEPEPEGSSPHSQQPITGLHPEPGESDLHPPPPPQPVSLRSNLFHNHIYASVFRMISFLRDYPPKPCTLFCPLPFMPHAPPISLFTTWSAWWYLEMSINYEAPHCATFFIFPLLHPS